MPNNFYDDLLSLGSDNEESSSSSSDFGSFYSDLTSPDFLDRGLPTDEWSPEEQKQEGWNTDFSDPWDVRNVVGPVGKLVFGNDNPVNRWIGGATTFAGGAVMKGVSAVSDLFQNALSEDQKITDNPEAYTTERVYNGMGGFSDVPVLKSTDALNTPEVKARRAEWEMSTGGVLADALKATRDQTREYADLLDETSAGLSTKKGEHGTFYDEISADIGRGDVWEGVKDTAGMMMDVSSNMAGMAAAGALVGGGGSAAIGASEMGAGMALGTFGDTYAELTNNENDSRAVAVMAAGIDALVEGKLETIGWETALGKGPVAQWFEGKVTDTVKKAMLARALITAPTEGAEEGLQGITNILAKNLPNVPRDGWESTLQKMATEAYEQIPDQVFVGAVFGGLLGPMVAGPQQAAKRLAAKDIAARFGNLQSDPKDKLAGAIDKAPSEEAAKTALVDAVEKVSTLAGGGDLSSINLNPDEENSVTGVSNTGMPFTSGEDIFSEAGGDGVAVDPTAKGPIGSDAGNGFVYAPGGYRVRVSKVSANGGIMLEKRSEAGSPSGFYVGKNGKLIDAGSINFADPKSLSLVWTPSSPAEQSAAEDVLREAAVMDRADPRRKEVLGRLAGIVSGNVGTAAVTDPSKPKKKKGIKIDPTQLDTLVDPFETEARKLAIWASAVKSGEKAADDTIKDVVQQQEQERAAIANSVNESDVDAAGERMMAAIEQIGQERQVQLESVSTLAQQLVQMQQGAQPQWNGQQGESAVAIGEPINLSTQEMAAAIQNKAAEVGVEIPESAVVDPAGFDWQGWIQEEVEMAKATAREGLKGPAEAIRASISLEPDHPIAQLASAPPAPTSGPTGASQAQPSVAAQVPQSNTSKVLAALKAAGSNRRANVSKDLLMVGRSTMIEQFRTIVNNQVNKLSSTANVPNDLSYDKMVEYLRKSVPKMSDKAWNSLLPTISYNVAKIESNLKKLVMNVDPGKAKTTKESVQHLLVALENDLLTQNTSGLFATPSTKTVPNIRALSNVTRDMKADESTPALYNPFSGNKLVSWVKTKAYELAQLAAIGPEDADQRRATVDKALDSYKSAEAILPQIKQIIFEVWQSAPDTLVARMGDAIRNGHDADVKGLARMVAEHVASTGMYLDLHDGIATNDSAAEFFGKALINTAQGVMSPWSMERAAREQGIDESVVRAMSSAFNAMAERWAMNNDKSVIEWWDRLADRVDVRTFKDSNLRGWAFSETPGQTYWNRRMIGMTGARNFAGGMISLFKTTPGGFLPKPRVSTILHESIHTLFMSGLMYEMLDQNGRDAMARLAKEPLWNERGDPLDISSKAHEYLAVGFEKFIHTNRAPNHVLKAAFEEIKQWFSKWVNGWIGYALVGHGTVQNSAEVPLYGSPVDNIYIANGDITLDGGIVRAFYQLMNAEPDGSEIAYMPSGLSIAAEKIIEAKTGVKAAGLFTKVQASESMVAPDNTPGWNIHKGTIPTESEWRGMLGLTNDDDNGTHTQETLMNMEEDRQRMGELSKRVVEQEKAQASGKMPSPVRNTIEQASAAVQKALASEKPLDDSSIYDPFMDNMMDTVMNSGKSGYNSGKKVDPSDPEQVKGLVRNFLFKMNSWSHLAGTKGIVYATAKVAREALATGTRQLIRATKFYESQLGNFMAPWERLFESLDPVTDEQIANVRNSTAGSESDKQKAVDAYILERKNLNMGQKAMMINNFHSLGKLADKVAEKRPQIWDATINGWRDIPGAKSHMEIQTEFSQMLETYWKNSPTAQSQYKDWYAFHEAAMRDLRAWMFSARQFELQENEKEADRQYDKAVAERERKIQLAQDASKTEPGAAYKVLDQKTYPEVKKPKVPRTTEEGNHWAESVKYLMEARYGKDLSMFKVAAAELTQWENHMVLDPLLASNMISEKEYSDMIAKGKSHIPMYRVRDAITKSGMLNPRIDDNTYKVVDYLKHDISMKSEDPLNAMLLKAAAIQTLTYRQAAKNALGMRILQDIKWWDGDNPESGVSIFVDKKEVTKEEYLELQKDPNNVLTMTQRFKKNAKGERVESGHSFYHHVPYTGEDMKAQLKHVLNSERAKAKYGNLTPEQRITKYEQSVFAFFPEPGKAMYVLITDPDLQKAFFYMNNPQAMYANSIRGRFERLIDEALPMDEQSSAAEKVAHYTARAVSSGYFGFNKVARGLMTSNPSFIFNMMPRDAPVSVSRSRHGLRWRDVPGQFLQATALLFPTLRELDPGKYVNAEDAADGIATFSGLAAADLDGALSADVMSSIVHTRGEKMTKARTGDFMSKVKLMWNDFGQFMAREGVNLNPARIWSQTKRGRNIGKNLMMIASSPLDIPKGVGQFIGTIFENATRLAERSLTMKEDMSQYPTLVHLYDPKKSIKGKLLAGFTGTEHRRKWEAAKAKLKVDPAHNVPQDALPVQVDATERDYSMAHVTLNFPQKGYLTTSINQLSLFNNPMHQDFYTNMYAITKHRWAKKALAYALGKDYIPAANQARMDEAAWRWMYKSFFYTTLPAAAMMLAYGTGDDDDSLEWQAQTFIEKMSYFWLPTNKLGLTKKPFRVATGLGLNKMLFADLPMAAWLSISGKDKRAANKWFNRFWENTPLGMGMSLYSSMASNTPGTVGEALGGQGGGWIGGLQSLATDTVPLAAPESVNPLFELAINKDKFRNKEIKMPEAIYNEDPTEIQREKYNLLVNTVTKKLDFLGLQPAQVQYLITRYFPGSAKWIPGTANKAMEMVAQSGPTGMPEDVLASNSPVAGQSPGFLPRVFAKPSWGMGNEFVQDLLHTAREATKQKNSYDGMVESRRPSYLAEHPLIQNDIFYGREGADGYRSGGLKDVSARIISQNKAINEQLKAGKIDATQAAELQKAYTLMAMEAMRNIITQLGE